MSNYGKYEKVLQKFDEHFGVIQCSKCGLRVHIVRQNIDELHCTEGECDGKMERVE